MKKKMFVIVCSIVMLACGCGKSMDAPAATEDVVVSDDAIEVVSAAAIEEEPEVEVVSEDAIEVEPEDDTADISSINPDSIEHIVDYFPEQVNFTTIEEAIFACAGDTYSHNPEHYILACDYLVTSSPDSSSTTAYNLDNIWQHILEEATADSSVEPSIIDANIDCTEYGSIQRGYYIPSDDVVNEYGLESDYIEYYGIAHTTSCQDNEVEILHYTVDLTKDTIWAPW